MADLEALKKLVDDAQAALAAAGVEAPPVEGVAQFASTTDVAPVVEEASFQSGTEHELSHVESAVSDVAGVVGDAAEVVKDVEASKPVDALTPAADLIAEIHAMVSDLHATVEGFKPFIGELAPIAEKLANSPLLKMVGI